VAVAYDNQSSLAVGTGDRNWTHTPTGTPAGALVLIVEEGGSDYITGVTYGGEAMTEVPLSPVLYAGAESGSIHGFFLSAPADTNAATVAIDTAAGSDQYIAACFTVTSATGASEIHDTSALAGGTAKTTVGATLTITEDSFVAGAMYSGLGAPSFTEVSGTQSVVEGDLGQDSGGISRGTSIKTTDFSYTWTQASDDGMALVVAICEATLPLTISPTAISGGEAFGTATLRSASTVVPTGISEPAGADYVTTITGDSPIAYWRLGESSGYPIDEIASRTAYAGSATQSVAGALTGDSDTANSFNGTSNEWVFADATALDLADGPLSIEAWVSRGALGANRVFVSKATGAYSFEIDLNGKILGRASNGNTFILANDALGTGWHHVVLTKNGASSALYVDGSAVGVTNPFSVTLVDNNQPFEIGADFDIGRYFNGSIDEVAVYNVVLTGTQISEHYTAGTTGGSAPIGSPTVTLGEPPAEGRITPTGISSTEAFGTATLLRGSVTVSATGIASAEAFGTATILRGNRNLVATAITSAEAFGTATLLRGGVTVSPSAIVSAQAFGTATILRGNVTITVTTIASAQALGTPILLTTARIVCNGITTAETFGTASVVRGGVSVLVGGIASSQALGTDTVLRGIAYILPTGIASAQAFGTEIEVSVGEVRISPSGIASTEAFGTATILRGNVTVLLTGIASAEALGTPTVGAIILGLTIEPTGITTAEALGNITLLLGGVILLPSEIASTEAFGTATLLRGSVTVQTSQIASTEIFGTITLTRGGVSIAPAAIASSGAFGTATLLRGGVLVLPTGIASAVAISSPLVSASAKILPTGIASAQVFSTPTLVVGGVSIRPSGIASAEAFGATFVSTGGSVIQPTGIASSETFGTATLLRGGRTVVVTGIATAQAFGTPVLLKTATIAVSGIASTGTYGVPVVIRGAVSIVPTGAATGEALGTPTIVSGAGVILPVPIGSAETFGNAAVQISAIPGQTVEPSSTTTAEIFGNATVQAGMVRALVTGIGTTEVVPNPVLYGHNDLAVIGITSAELFGLPVVAKGSAYIQPSGIASGEVVPSATIANLLDSWRWVNNAPALIGTRPGGFPVLQSGLYDTTRQEGEG